MAPILGYHFAETKLLKASLETLFGVGHTVSSRVLAKFCIHPRATVGSLDAKTTAALTAELTNMTIEGELRRKIKNDIYRLRDMGSYRGRRHAMGLPVRGQKTRTQILTARKLNGIEKYREV